ncbi:stress response protein nst1-like [Olea europaea var. sylvestris]|uniref:stress response protein nst1-like n=1 Tax=Olea europaea var. sylvestris TaxID=158386 RepID=UPI000C1CEA1F|nr:stress response protein nst1-like [Olea europaea var. sylvestris]
MPGPSTVIASTSVPISSAHNSKMLRYKAVKATAQRRPRRGTSQNGIKALGKGNGEVPGLTEAISGQSTRPPFRDLLDYLQALSPSREVTAALLPPLRDSVKSELDKLMEAKDQALNLYNSMKAERAQFAIKEKEYKEKLNMMGFELNSRLEIEEKWMGKIRALREEADRRAKVEKKRIEEERVRTEEAVEKVREANERAREAMRRVEEAESRAARAVETWRSSSKFDALAQDAYIVVMEEVVKHIRRKRLGFDMGFFEEAVEEQKEELQRLSEATGVRISSANEDDVAHCEDLPSPSIVCAGR